MIPVYPLVKIGPLLQNSDHVHSQPERMCAVPGSPQVSKGSCAGINPEKELIDELR